MQAIKAEQIYLAQDTEHLQRCFAVIWQLRPHLSWETFLPQVQRQQVAGYRLAYLEAHGSICGVAGFRLLESLSSGKFLYVDDLVIDAEQRSRGYGAALLDWLIAYARTEGCCSLELDSGVQRAEAHRFYFRQRLHISGYHFSLSLE